jgi:glycosyltransferase involved in cell wall biosynthesis
MKILIVVPVLAPLYGGPSKVVPELSEAIGEQGVTVDIITTNANGSTTLDVPLLTWIQEKNYRIQYFPQWNFFGYQLTWSLTRWLFRNVSKYDIPTPFSAIRFYLHIGLVKFGKFLTLPLPMVC